MSQLSLPYLPTFLVNCILTSLFMNGEENTHEFLIIMNKLKQEGMDRDLYEKIANEFGKMQEIPSVYLIELLRDFVSFQGEALYVNEIKNFLKEVDHELFIEYGRRFRNCKGCYEVFGIEPENVVEYNFKIESKVEEPKVKNYKNIKKKFKSDRKIKRHARMLAIEKQKEKTVIKEEKRKQRDKLDELMRKEDL